MLKIRIKKGRGKVLLFFLYINIYKSELFIVTYDLTLYSSNWGLEFFLSLLQKGEEEEKPAVIFIILTSFLIYILCLCMYILVNKAKWAY